MSEKRIRLSIELPEPLVKEIDAEKEKNGTPIVYIVKSALQAYFSKKRIEEMEKGKNVNKN
jgi:metal-responsive CopG/Arc/MetJ family transcriptional regulator